MSDLISRADAIEAVCRDCTIERKDKCKAEGYCYEVQNLQALPSADAPKGDLISRQWLLEVYGDYIGDNGEPKYHVPLEVVRQNIKDAPSADAVHEYTEWLEKIIVYNGSNEWLCEDTPDMDWCEKNCHYSSIQAECLRHLYEVSKGGDDE